MGNSQSMCNYCKDHQDSKLNHTGCTEPYMCQCTCNVGGGHDIAQKTSAITAGVGGVVGGVFLTVSTGGIVGIVAGSVALGVGVSSATNGFTAVVKGKKMNAVSYGIDAGIGAVSGVLTGGAGGVALKCATTACKVKTGALLCSAANTAIAAAAEGANVGKKRIDGDNEYKFNKHTLWVGATTGAFGGAAIGGSGALVNKAAEVFETTACQNVTKAVTRLVADVTTGVADSAIKQAGNVANGEEFNSYALLGGVTASAIGSVMSTGSRNLEDKVANFACRRLNLPRETGKAVLRIGTGAVSEVTKAAVSGYANADENSTITMVTQQGLDEAASTMAGQDPPKTV